MFLFFFPLYSTPALLSLIMPPPPRARWNFPAPCATKEETEPFGSLPPSHNERLPLPLPRSLPVPIAIPPAPASLYFDPPPENTTAGQKSPSSEGPTATSRSAPETTTYTRRAKAQPSGPRPRPRRGRNPPAARRGTSACSSPGRLRCPGWKGACTERTCRGYGRRRMSLTRLACLCKKWLYTIYLVSLHKSMYVVRSLSKIFISININGCDLKSRAGEGKVRGRCRRPSVRKACCWSVCLYVLSGCLAG